MFACIHHETFSAVFSTGYRALGMLLPLHTCAQVPQTCDVLFQVPHPGTVTKPNDESPCHKAMMKNLRGHFTNLRDLRAGMKVKHQTL